MATFKSRFPSKQQIVYAYGAIAFPIFLIALVGYLYKIDAYVLMYDWYDIVGVAAYVLGVALFESLVLLLVMLALAVVLPASWIRNRFPTQSGVFVLVSLAWALTTLNFVSFEVNILRRLGAVIALYSLSLILGWVLAARYERIERLMRSAVERVSVLSYIFVATGCLGVIIVLFRNLF